MSRHVLVVRLDSLGDVLICGPAVRAVAAHADRVTMLVSRRGAAAAELLPGVADVVVWDCPWITAPPRPVRRADVLRLASTIAELDVDEALILTSFHQSALPTALLLALAEVRVVAAVSTDYPGTLLSTRIAEPADGPEPERMLSIAAQAGYWPMPADHTRLAITDPGDVPDDLAIAALDRPYVVLHPGADAPARSYPVEHWLAVAARLESVGYAVVVTGSPAEATLGDAVADVARVLDLTGRTDVRTLAAVLRDAAVVVVGNTGPAHLAAAVGTPVVSLFAPVVPAQRWAPYGVDSVVLGDQDAACAGTRARECPVPGHPCLSTVDPDDVVAAVQSLEGCELLREVAR